MTDSTNGAPPIAPPRTKAQTAEYIDGLLEERARYQAGGLDGPAQEVTEELAKVGYVEGTAPSRRKRVNDPRPAIDPRNGKPMHPDAQHLGTYGGGQRARFVGDINDANRRQPGMTEDQRRAQVAALLTERDYCHGDKHQVALIDVELVAYGYEAGS